MSGLHNYRGANGKPASTAKFSDFKGKLLILDFWATWCSPCVAMFPKMDSLQKALGNQVSFLSITYQTEKEVLPFLVKLEQRLGRQIELPIAMGHEELHHLFPHVYLPHYVWINADGIVGAITGHEEINEANIREMIAKGRLAVQKKDLFVKHLVNQPFLVDGNGGDGSGFLSHSIITGYKPGIGGGYYLNQTPEGDQLTLKNQPISKMFGYAYGENKIFFAANQMRMEVKDLDALRVPMGVNKESYNVWARKNAYCYELILPKALRSSFYKRMQQELSNYFNQYKVVVVREQTKCLALVKVAETGLLKTRGAKPSATYKTFGCELTNVPLDDLVRMLSIKYMPKSVLPIVNATGSSKRVDLKLDVLMTDLVALNTGLAPYGLTLREQMHEVDMLVIKDNMPEVLVEVPNN
ncbi:MAG: TlpA family protein disulfide reductase [Sphingobacteriales bacterium]|nr:MAG: TlpA family protein disulfide reductase [Sphingobacteriales bacterium]